MTTQQNANIIKENKNFELKICFGGAHCLKLEDKEHSTQFIHFKPVNISFFQCYIFFSFVDKLTID
jgi:hypothetical protein